MPYVLLHEQLPELAERETRSLTVPRNSSFGWPAGEYGFLEMFCDEDGCDCRRVFFSVLRKGRRETQAVVAYGWESLDFYANWMGDRDPVVLKNLKGPVLNPGSPATELAPAILEMVKCVLLADSAYVERIKRHYRLFRAALGCRRSVPARADWTSRRKRLRA